MVGEQDAAEQSGGAGAAAHAEGNLVVEADVEWGGGATGAGEDVAVGLEDHVVVGAGAAVGVAAGGLDGERRAGGVGGEFGVEGEGERQGEAGGVEGGAEVGGGGGQDEADGRHGLVG